MELLSVAQKYQMGTALAHIRASVAQQNLLPTRLEPALRIYALAQKYGLRQEALQTARTISKFPMTIEDFDNKLDIMPGASLYELWKYHERVLAILASDLAEFRESGARGTITDSSCTEPSSSQIPRWLDQYIESIATTPNLFDSAELHIAMARHLQITLFDGEFDCECSSIPSQSIREFWEALASVVNSSFTKAESALCLVREREDSQVQIHSTTSQPVTFDVSDANLILQSSDLVNFRVHKLVLAIVSPFFKDMLSLPQSPDSETVDGLPVIQLSEDSELLNCLVSMLYPLHPVKPNSYDKVLYLLAACQKYEMDSVQSFIRTKVKCEEFPAPKGTEVFAAYAIASGKGLIPEMEKAARGTLRHPMTFETLGENLRLFEGWALRDLTNYRRRCFDNAVKCLDPFLEPSGPSGIWAGCPEVTPSMSSSEACQQSRALPTWLNEFLSRNQGDLELHKFTKPLGMQMFLWSKFFQALQTHVDCNFCMRVQVIDSLTYCLKLEKQIKQVLDKVTHSFDVSISTANFTCYRYTVIAAVYL
ncbi:hypothetical protein F5888DRAFT_1735928, partial [Russula emetica]